MEALQAESTLEGQRKTLQQAIAKKPDGIAVSGMETDSYGDLYKKAAAQGIAIICSACMSRPGSGLLDSHIAGPKMLDLWGQMIAAFTVANVKGTPNVQMFGISVYPILAPLRHRVRGVHQEAVPGLEDQVQRAGLRHRRPGIRWATSTRPTRAPTW